MRGNPASPPKYRICWISYVWSLERGWNVCTVNDDAHNQYCCRSKFWKNHSYREQILYISDTAYLEEHFDIDFVEYLVLEILLFSKSKLLREFLYGRHLRSDIPKNFITLKIKLTRGLACLSLQEYIWTPFSLTVAILDRLERPVLLFVIFHISAYD